MRTNKVEWFGVIDGGKSGAWRDSRSADSRATVLLAIVLVMRIGSAGALILLRTDGGFADPAGPAAESRSATDEATAVPYFPSQYVNQTRDAEAAPPAF